MVHKTERGDTLVEVLMAIVILSLVVVGAITMMSRGLAAAQISVEHTQVRLEVNGQTEMLRLLRDGWLQDPTGPAGREWARLFDDGYVNTAASSLGGACSVTTGKQGFYLAKTGPAGVQITIFNPANQPAAAASPGSGLWIEATRSASTVSPAYIDFQIRACWQGSGSSAQQQTVTAVRLYDPAH